MPQLLRSGKAYFFRWEIAAVSCGFPAFVVTVEFSGPPSGAARVKPAKIDLSNLGNRYLPAETPLSATPNSASTASCLSRFLLPARDPRVPVDPRLRGSATTRLARTGGHIGIDLAGRTLVGFATGPRMRGVGSAAAMLAVLSERCARGVAAPSLCA